MTTRYWGPVAAAASCALLALVAFDAGGFHAVTWDRALVALVLAGIALPLGRPVGPAALFAGALAALAAWTALSWTWSESPPSALAEAQRVTLYALVAAVVVAAGGRISRAWLVRGVLAAVTLVCLWDVATRLAPDWTGQTPTLADIGGLGDPIGYANGVALLAALGLVLTFGEPWAAPLQVPFAAVLGLQASLGADGAAAIGTGAFVLAAPRLAGRVLALGVLPAVAGLVAARDTAVASPLRTDLLAASHPGHRLAALLLVLVIAQALVAYATRALRLPPLPGRVAGAALVVAALAAAPFAIAGHERGHYWRAAAHEIAAHPVLGSGAGTYVDWWLRTRDVALPTQEAHSLYLETLAELGPLGLALLATAFGVALWSARRQAALLGGIVVYASGAAFDFDWELAGVTLPAVVLAACAVSRASPAGRPLPRIVVAPVLALVGVAAALALAGNAAIDRGDTASAMRWAPYSTDTWLLVARTRARSGDVPGARAAYRHALRLDPRDWTAWIELASVTSGEPRRSALAEAARLNPLGGSPAP